MKGLTAMLEEITPGNGYQHDLRGRVFRGRILFGASDPLPLVALLEPPLPIDQIIARGDPALSTGDWEIMVQGFVDDDPTHPLDPAYRLVADVRKRLALAAREGAETYDYGLPAVTGMSVGPGVVRPSDDISARAYFWLSLRLKIAEDMTDPYL